MAALAQKIKCEAERIYLAQEATIFDAHFSQGYFIAMTSASAASTVAVAMVSDLKKFGFVFEQLERKFCGTHQIKPEEIKVKVLAIAQAPLSFPKSAIPETNRTLVTRTPEAGRPKEVLYFHPEARMRVSLPPEKARVLIVDDSKTVCSLLTRIFSSSPDLEVVGAIHHPNEVPDAIRRLKPTVLTFDISMPEKDGVTLLKEILPKFKLPVVMISALSMEDGNQVLDALEAGAVDYIQKPSFDQLETVSPIMIEKVKLAATLKPKMPSVVSGAKKPSLSAFHLNPDSVIVLGASTGGTEAIREVLTHLPEEIPPILIVQHIPAVFSKAFADRLNSLCPFEVKEAVDGDVVAKNRVLIGPGGFQMKVEKRGTQWVVRVLPEPPVNRHCPSVDVLFDSAAQKFGSNAIGVLLTGMGADGAKGLLNLRKAGCHTIAQDEASCVVFGMPKQAIELGAAERIEALDRVAGTMLGYARASISHSA